MTSVQAWLMLFRGFGLMVCGPHPEPHPHAPDPQSRPPLTPPTPPRGSRAWLENGIGRPVWGCLGGVEGSDPGGFCKKGCGSLVKTLPKPPKSHHNEHQGPASRASAGVCGIGRMVCEDLWTFKNPHVNLHDTLHQQFWGWGGGRIGWMGAWVGGVSAWLHVCFQSILL